MMMGSIYQNKNEAQIEQTSPFTVTKRDARECKKLKKKEMRDKHTYHSELTRVAKSTPLLDVVEAYGESIT